MTHDLGREHSARAAYKGYLPGWIVAIGAGIPLAMIGFAASPIGYHAVYVLAAEPALLLIWAAAGAYAALLSVRAMVRRKWRESVIAAVLPVVILFIAINPDRFNGLRRYVANEARFVLLRSDYDTQIALLPANDKLRLAVFEWDGMPWVTFAVVYDESDQIVLPRGEQSAEWLAQAKQKLFCENYGVVQPFRAHYYLVSFPC